MGSVVVYGFQLLTPNYLYFFAKLIKGVCTIQVNTTILPLNL